MMSYVYVLPHLNALLNTLSGLLLLTGFLLIRRRNIKAHRRCMLAAFITSTIFLVSYVVYHSLLAYYFKQGPTRFTGQGLARPIYFTVLISHTILAVAVVPFILLTLFRALRGQFDKHLRIARWTFPIWLYVSITGVIVYLMLYHLYPSGR
jgi:uncharacterized membrane protein YozB (DUF420 family)